MYSNTNFHLLGELIEQLSGQKYGTFIQNEVLNPLGMTGTQELGESPTVSDQAVGYGAPRNGRWPRVRTQNGPALYAAAGMVSSAQDMGTYMAALLSGSLLQPSTYALMWSSTPTPNYGTNPASSAHYGLGWDMVIGSGAMPTEVYKGGQVPGYTSELLLYPATGSGVFVSFNSTNPGGVSALQVAQSIEAAVQSGN